MELRTETELTQEIERHPVVGAEIVDGIEFPSEATKVVRSHHERWDSTGYPDGLRAEEIPLAARVFAVADERAGADLFLTKPFSPLELLRLVDRLGGDVPA